MSLLEQKVFLFDCQTTGTRPAHDHLLEVAYTWTTALDSFPPEINSAILRLPGDLPPRIALINGIDAESLTQAEEPSLVWKEFHRHASSYASPEQGTFAVAHYAQFERSFLKKFYAERGAGEKFPLTDFCSYRIAKRLFPEAPSGNIRGLAGYLGLDLGEIRRAREHVLATTVIWQRIATELHRLGVENREDLTKWMATKPAGKTVRTNFHVDRNKRLQLPKGPGIYRMLSRNKEVLYVGKAKSLRARVNSYFRGGCTGDRRKLEMLARVWDVEVEECGSALEAALRENDEIKRLRPRYNRALLPSERALLFFDRNLTEFSEGQDVDHPLGPFREMGLVANLSRMIPALNAGVLGQLFFDEIPELILSEGFALFRGQENLREPLSLRMFLGLGARILRQADPEEQTEEEIDEEEVEVTATDVADRFRRLAARSAEEYFRAKRLGRLVNAAVSWEAEEGSWRSLVVESGRIRAGESSSKHILFPWQGLGGEQYDRLSVLLSELDKGAHRVLSPRVLPELSQ